MPYGLAMRAVPVETTFVVGGRAEPGLLLSVSGAPQRPATRVEYAGRFALRFSGPNGPLAYARIGAWEEIAWLGPHASSTGVVAPITADDMRLVAGARAPRGEGHVRAWMRHLLASLSPEATPLFDGTWAMAPVPVGARADAQAYPRNPADGLHGCPPLAWRLEAVASPRPLTRDDWACGWGDALVPMGAVWPLRAPSSDGARAHALRKRARDGLLAPALLLYVSAIGGYVVLDGHDRIAAALAENSPPPLIALWPTRPPTATTAASLVAAAPRVPAGPPSERLESALRRDMAEHQRYGAHTRAWRLPGGFTRWRDEVRTLLARTPTTALDPDDVAFLVDD